MASRLHWESCMLDKIRYYDIVIKILLSRYQDIIKISRYYYQDIFIKILLSRYYDQDIMLVKPACWPDANPGSRSRPSASHLLDQSIILIQR